MLKTEFKQNLQKRIKDTFFNTQMELMSNRLQPPFIISVFLQLISFWLNISIFFIYGPLEPQVVNEIFNFPLIPSLSSRTGIDIDIFKFCLLIQGVVFIVLTAAHLRRSLINNVLTKIFNILIFENQLLLVLKAHLMVTVLQSITSDSALSQDIINIIYSVIINIEIAIVGLFTYFKVKPFRKKSIFWSFDNRKQFISYVMNFFRVLIIIIDGRSVSFLIVSFLVDFIIWSSCLRFYTKENTKIQIFGVNLSLSAHISLIVCYFASSPQLGTQILVFLLLVSLINTVLSCYSLMNEERYFPLCNSEIYEFYDFYFNFVENKIKGSNRTKMMKKDTQSDKMFTIHLLNCHQKNCMVRNVKFSQQTFCEDLQNLCNQVMKTKFQHDKQTQIIYELWKFQTGNKFKFRMQTKQLDILHEYIIFCALNLGRLNEKSDQVNQENIKSLKGVFYDKLQGTLECFSLFYEEITKTQPKMDTILTVGNDIKKRTQDLKCLYSDLLKHSVINFKTAEVYVQFENFFLKENNVTEESIDRLRKIQKSKQSDHIEEIYLPTLTAYSETGLIENMNTECLSFFRQTRFQLKSKNINSLLYPQVDSMRQIKQKLKANKSQKLYTFFRRRDQIVFGSILVKQKYIDSKKFDVIIIQKNPYSDYRNVFLLNKETYEIQCLEKQETFIRPSINNNTQVVLNWRYLFLNYLKPKIATLIDQKVIKIRIPEVQNNLFVMNIEETFEDDYLIVNTKVIKDMDRKRNRVSSFMLNKPQPNNPKEDKFFHFCYDLKNPLEATLLGVNQNRYNYNQTLRRTPSLKKFQRELSNLVVAGTLLRQNRFSHGIKTYRLYEGQLYNIDLQDKQKYIEQFHDHVASNKDHSMLETSEADLYMIAGIFFTLLILIALSVAYNVIAASTHDTVLWDYSNGFRVEQLRLQMNRMCSITRDYELGLYNITGKDYRPQLTVAYNALKTLRYQSLLFDSQQIEVTYRNINYTGTLNEIIDVMVSHIYQMTIGAINSTEIEYFQDSYISTVNPKIINQKAKLIADIETIANGFQKMQDLSLIVGIICIFVFYVLLGALVAILNNSAMIKLKNLMMMSDNEARMNQVMADKLLYAVDMIKKNFDFDLKAIIGPAETHRQRRKPKQAIIGIQKKLLIFLALAAGFIVHLVLFYNFASKIEIILTQIKRYAEEGNSFIETYSMFTQQTNQITHFNTYNPSVIASLREKVSQLANNKLKYNFDDQTNLLVDLIFFQNACQQLWDMGMFPGATVVCGKFLPNYFVSNPLQLGFVAYFSRIHYYILDNITQTYGVTGIYSGPFVILFSTLADKISQYGINFIQDSFDQLLIYNVIYIIVSLIYIVVTVTVIYFLKRMNKEINQLLSFLNYSTNSTTKHKKSRDKDNAKVKGSAEEKKKDDESTKKKDSSISSISDEKIPESQNSQFDEEHALHNK